MAQILYTNAVTVTTGATRLLASNKDAEFRSIANGAAVLYIGGSGVTTATGYTMAASTVLTMAGGDDRHSGLYSGELWAIVTTGTLVVRTLEAQSP